MAPQRSRVGALALRQRQEVALAPRRWRHRPSVTRLRCPTGPGRPCPGAAAAPVRAENRWPRRIPTMRGGGTGRCRAPPGRRRRCRRPPPVAATRTVPSAPLCTQTRDRVRGAPSRALRALSACTPVVANAASRAVGAGDLAAPPERRATGVPFCPSVTVARRASPVSSRVPGARELEEVGPSRRSRTANSTSSPFWTCCWQPPICDGVKFRAYAPRGEGRRAAVACRGRSGRSRSPVTR